MKAFASFASLATMAAAATDVGPWTYSQADTTTIFTAPLGDVIWKLTTYSAYDEDNGYEYFRMQHELTAPIKATDQVTFEISFTTKNDPWVDKMTMSDDIAICKVVQSTQNTLLWT